MGLECRGQTLEGKAYGPKEALLEQQRGSGRAASSSAASKPCPWRLGEQHPHVTSWTPLAGLRCKTQQSWGGKPGFDAVSELRALLAASPPSPPAASPGRSSGQVQVPKHGPWHRYTGLENTGCLSLAVGHHKCPSRVSLQPALQSTASGQTRHIVGSKARIPSGAVGSVTGYLTVRL